MRRALLEHAAVLRHPEEHDRRGAVRRGRGADRPRPARGRRDPARRAVRGRARCATSTSRQLVNSGDPTGLPVGVKIKGDADGIKGARQARHAAAGARRGSSSTETERRHRRDRAPTPTTAPTLLEDGGLGDSETFQDVVREADAGRRRRLRRLRRRRRLAGRASPRTTRRPQENLEPLSALGISAWLEDGDLARRAAADDRLSSAQARPTRATIAPVIATRSAGRSPGRGRAAARDADRRRARAPTRRRRSGAGASARPGRSRRRRTRSRARRRPPRPSPPCCRRAPGPAP